MKPESPGWLDTGMSVGRQQAFAVMANKCSAAQALSLKQTKESDCHGKLGLSWEEFCERHAGLSCRQADRIIAQYDEFGEAYFRLASLARISADGFRGIAQSVEGECIEIEGEKVPIIPENAARIRAFVRDQKAVRSPKPGPASPTPGQIDLRLRHLLMDVEHCAAGRLSSADREFLQRTVGHAIREWIEIGHRLDRLGK